MGASKSRLSARISAITESATLAVDAKAKAMKAAGRPVIGFGAGEPDFPTPGYIVEAAQRACAEPRFHKYSPTPGLPELREAIAAKTARDSGLAVQASQVLVTNGGKQAVYQAFATLLDPGDEVLLPAPYWTTYPEVIALAGGVVVPVPTDESTGYLTTVADLEAHCTDRTKMLRLRLAVEPDRRGLPARPGRRDRPVGRRQGNLGGDRRDLRAPGLRQRQVHLDPGRRARSGRPLRGAQRRRQDLRHDRLAGRLDDRAAGRDQGGHQPAVARHLERLQRRAGSGAGRGLRRPVRGGSRCARPSTAAGSR